MVRVKRRGTHSVYDLRVHLVWITKYRYEVLNGKMGHRVREIVQQFFDSNDILILTQRLKGKGSRQVQKRISSAGKMLLG